MAHATMTDMTDQGARSDLQHRCMCCGGMIENLSDETISIGLDLKLGLVSDECALICNDCTAKLVEAKKLQGQPSHGRR
jgi:hypothetical protein